MEPIKLYESGSTTISIEPAMNSANYGWVTVRVLRHGMDCHIISADGNKAKHAIDILRDAIVNIKEGW